MEIKHLEEQFNPHFVYNVMETVRYQISEDPETASEMLLSFASAHALQRQLRPHEGAA